MGSRRRIRTRRVLAAGIAALMLSAAPPAGSLQTENGDQALQIVMVTFRGCEEACTGFHDYIEASGLDAEIVVRDIGRDRRLLPELVEEVTAMQPDLLVTWGTTVTRGMIGTLDDDAGAVRGVPTVFMIVADPVGAGIVESYEGSGRPYITGTRNRVPEDTQMRVLADYRPFTRIGLIYNDDELNAVLKADEMHAVAADQGFEIVERVIANDADGVPMVDDIPQAVADIAAEEVDFLYVGSSSFLLANADAFTTAALDHGLAVATAYEAMVRDSHGLIALASAYYNVGQLAAFQAERILAGGETPGDMEILGLNRFTVLVNIDTAHALGLYPPMLLLRYAEIVGEGSRP
jgi:putative ABC transport system substrate-binding protein